MYNEYYEGFSLMNNRAKDAGVTTSDVSLQIVQNNLKTIQDYVRRGGNIPESNPIKLAVQAALTHENSIAKKMRLENLTYEAAEKKVLSEENRKQYFSGEGEEFLGLTLAALTDLAKKGIAKINEVRAAKGKPALLSGPWWQRLKAKGEKAGLELKQTDEGKITLSANLPSTSGKQTEVGAGLEAVGTELESQKKKEFLKKNLIWIILGAVVLIGGVIYLARKK